MAGARRTESGVASVGGEFDGGMRFGYVIEFVCGIMVIWFSSGFHHYFMSIVHNR